MAMKLSRCLKSILETQNLNNLEIIVVNKHSRDNTEVILKENFSSVRLVKSQKFGIAHMRNIGIKNAKGDYILLLDADTIIKDDLTPSLEFLKNHPDSAGLGVKLISPEDKLLYSCRTFYDFKTIVFRRTPLGCIFPNSSIIKKHLMVEWDHNSTRVVDWVQGAFFLIRRKALNDIGLFDEFSPFGFEDVAWCFRAKKKNWNIYYYPYITVIHEYQRSSASIFSPRAFYHLWAFMRFFLKYRFFRR